jgi:hypothetical protein
MNSTCFDKILDYLTHNTTINDEYFDKRGYCSFDESCPNDCRIDNLMDLLSLMVEYEEDESTTLRVEPDLPAFVPNVINLYEANDLR